MVYLRVLKKSYCLQKVIPAPTEIQYFQILLEFHLRRSDGVVEFFRIL